MTLQFNPARANFSPRFVAALFTVTIFVSASLLFFVQPLFTRIVLPSIGGASAVWTTAMLFFQSVLIAGYFYAHLSTRYLTIRWQMALHLLLWAFALLFLPLALPDDSQFEPGISPALHTLILYALGVGMPFAVLSANAPLIQAWYSRSGGPSAEDPYFLYGASNLGSLMSLLAFPFVAEPLLGITAIGQVWAIGFVALGALLFACGMQRQANGMGATPVDLAQMRQHVAKPKLRDFALWALLAFIPSSLMLAVTSKISTDLGSFPLIWVVPLALYLLTFVLTFTNTPVFSSRVLTALFRASMVGLVLISTNMTAGFSIWLTIAILIASFFVVCATAHATLFDHRPAKEHLTLFYVTMSIGGALGGLFNSIIAPMVFDDIHELRIVVVIATVLLLLRSVKGSVKDILLGAAIGLAALQPFVLAEKLMTGIPILVQILATGAILMAAYVSLAKRAYAPAAATAVVVALSTYLTPNDAILRERSFFGVHLVQDVAGIRRYVQGTTIHGAERLADFGKRPTPITYYIPTGPMGQIFLSDRGKAAKTVGVVGLGVGALACYRQPGQAWDFYEIDKAVDDIARNAEYFTFMSSCAGDDPTHIGDARIELEKQAGKKFDILVIDAYSSDAVPVHLTTVEAMALFRSRLAPGGVLVFHISNRYFDIDVPLARSAAHLGLTAWIQRYTPEGDGADGQNLPSVVVAMTEEDQPTLDFGQNPAWAELESDGGLVWTDDYANPLSILR